MKAEHINPFLKSAIETFKTMVNVAVKPGKPFLRKEACEADISGIVNISGNIQGLFVIAYPAEMALKICSRFIGEDIKELNASVADCIGELTNIITGFAKQDLKSLHFSISLPSIVYKKSGIPAGEPVICIPFESEIGNFFIEASYDS